METSATPECLKQHHCSQTECLEIQQNSSQSSPPEKSRRLQNFLGCRNEGPKTSSFDYKYVLSPHHLLLFHIHLSHIMSPLYPGQLLPFQFETETKLKSKQIRPEQIWPKQIRPKQIRPKQIRPNWIRPKQVRLNVAEHQVAIRVSMSTLRRWKLQFDYEAYQA